MARNKTKKIHPMTASKETKVEEFTPAPKHWLLNCNLKHNGTRYLKDSICPQEKVEELKALGFVDLR